MKSEKFREGPVLPLQGGVRGGPGPALIFDYGGTLDTGGIHWADLLWQIYQHHHVPVDHDTFYEAYVHTERRLGREPLILPEHTFLDVLMLKVTMQFQHLRLSHSPQPLIQEAYTHVQQEMEHTRPLLQQLSTLIPHGQTQPLRLLLVSNFYGNLPTVLREFRLAPYFSDVIESAAVGIRKPDPAIFRLALSRNDLKSDEVLVVGDSLKNDIQPAHTLGIPTVWFSPHADAVPPEADHHITDLRQLLDLLLQDQPDN